MHFYNIAQTGHYAGSVMNDYVRMARDPCRSMVLPLCQCVVSQASRVSRYDSDHHLPTKSLTTVPIHTYIPFHKHLHLMQQSTTIRVKIV